MKMTKSWERSRSFFAPNAKKSESSNGLRGPARNSSVILLDRNTAGNAASAAAHSVSRDDKYQATDSWSKHREINMVMLATSLAPDEFLMVRTDETPPSIPLY